MGKETDKRTEIEELELEIEQWKIANKSLQDRIDAQEKLLWIYRKELRQF